MFQGAKRISVPKKTRMSDNENPIAKSPEEQFWFAMSATFGRGLKAKTFLEDKSVECFVPMKYEIVNDRKEGKVRKLIPAISNLIFVHTTKKRIQSLKALTPYLQYLTKPVGERNVPITVPEKQMLQFIKVCDTYDDKLLYLAPHEIRLKEGTPVRIVGSMFDGVEGTFLKVDGSRKKRVVVLLQDVTAVVLAEFTDGYLQVLK